MDSGIKFCPLCEEPVLAGDPVSSTEVNGMPAHHECMFRALVGGANHIRKCCTCCGGTEPPDPPGLTKREAAREAMRAYRELNPVLPPPTWER